MNDLSELQYAREIMEDRLQLWKERSDLSDVQQTFLSWAIGGFDPFRHGASSVYSVSFCEDGNLLSQWRAYRDQSGGYAIGFDFFHTLRFLDRRCALRKVIYEVDDQNELIDQTVEACLSAIPPITADRPDNEVEKLVKAVVGLFSSLAGEFLFCLKHPTFREEREWRLVHFATIDPLLSRGSEAPQFRSYDGNVIPYFPVSFNKAIEGSKDDAMGIGFPIREVVIGPTVSPELNGESVSLLLSSINPDMLLKIRSSEIPLRWL